MTTKNASQLSEQASGDTIGSALVAIGTNTKRSPLAKFAAWVAGGINVLIGNERLSYTSLKDAPMSIVRFAAIDANTADAISDGEIGLYTADGTQIQTTDIAQARVIYIPKRAAAFGTDAADANTDLDSYDVSRLGEDLLANPGIDALVAIWQYGRTEIVWFQAQMVAAHGTGGYKLSEIEHLKGSRTAPSEGVGWNVIVGLTHGVAVSGIIDNDKLVFKTELQGHEDDAFASYNNAFIQNDYRRGDWVLTSDTSGAPTEANQVRQPDIASGSGTVCFSIQLRTDADPDQLAWATADAAADYPSGRIIYASIDGDKSAHLAITLTGAGTLVTDDGNNGSYIYAPASWVETGDIASVQEYGDYFRIGTELPSQLQIEIPWTDILGAPWLKPTGVVRTDGEVDGDTKVMLADGSTITFQERDEYHDEHHIGDFTVSGLSYNTSNSNSGFAVDDVNYSAGSVIQGKGQTGVIYYKYADDAARRSFRNKIIVGRRVEIAQTGPTAVLKCEVDSTPANLFGRLAFNVRQVTLTGTLTDDADLSLITRSNIPATDQIEDFAYKDSDDKVPDDKVPDDIARKPIEVLNVTSLTTAWTKLAQTPHAYTDDTVFEARIVGLADGNRRIDTAKFRLGDLDANNWWIPWNAVQGYRVEVRRSAANTLQYQKQPSGFSTFRFRLFIMPDG